MTAKRSPLDFIINDSAARSDKQKAREYSAGALNQALHTKRVGRPLGALSGSKLESRP